MTNLRPEITRHLHGRLVAFREGFRQNLALIGLPGSGKTFQLQRLMANPPIDAVWICCPLYRESCRSFLQRLRWAMLHAGLSVSSAGGPPSQTAPYETLLRAARLALPATAAALSALEPLLSKRSLTDAFTATLNVVPLLIKETGRPCVLIFDEFVWLQEMGLAQPFHELGKRVMTWPSTFFILTSSSPYLAKQILREQLQLLFGQFELMALDPLRPETVTSWLETELHDLRGAELIGPFLVQWLGASPWALTVFVKRLKELAALRLMDDAAESLLWQTAWDVLGRSEGTLHQWCGSRLEGLANGRLGAKAVETLLQIAGGLRTMSALTRRLGRSRLSDTLQLLLEHDLASRHGSCWIVPDPMLRGWLSSVLAAQRAAHADEASVRERFLQYLQTLWAQWRHERHVPVCQRVVTWLSRFNDEVVALDSKLGQLPKFDTITASDGADGAPAYLIASGKGKQWCVTVHEGPVDEHGIATFDEFCRRQPVKPSRKVVVTTTMLDEPARVLAKASKMWIWAPEALEVLQEVYGSAAAG